MSDPDKNYDVFLSFTGKDTRNNFTSHLYDALNRSGINVFIDNKITKGEKITSALSREIENAKMSVVVLSKNYTKSKDCMDELAQIMKCRETKGQIVLPIFYKMDPSHLTYLKEFDNLEANYDREEVERWKSAFTGIGDLAGWHIDEYSDEVKVIGEVTETVLGNLKLNQFKPVEMWPRRPWSAWKPTRPIIKNCGLVAKFPKTMAFHPPWKIAAPCFSLF